MNPIQHVAVQPSYVLYAKPFRETSLLLEVFSRSYGRVSLVARGARSNAKRVGKNNMRQGLLRPFLPLLLSWRGRGELLNLIDVESNGVDPNVTGKLLSSGWYLNELLVRTIEHADAQVQLYDSYHTALYGLKNDLILHLRQFEKNLLSTLGIMPILSQEQHTNTFVKANKFYKVCPASGVIPVDDAQYHAKDCFQGNILLAVQRNDWHQSEYWPAMKRLFRLLLDYSLRGRTLRSRELLQL